MIENKESVIKLNCDARDWIKSVYDLLPSLLMFHFHWVEFSKLYSFHWVCFVFMLTLFKVTVCKLCSQHSCLVQHEREHVVPEFLHAFKVITVFSVIRNIWKLTIKWKGMCVCVFVCVCICAYACVCVKERATVFIRGSCKSLIWTWGLLAELQPS